MAVAKQRKRKRARKSRTAVVSSSDESSSDESVAQSVEKSGSSPTKPPAPASSDSDEDESSAGEIDASDISEDDELRAPSMRALSDEVAPRAGARREPTRIEQLDDVQVSEEVGKRRQEAFRALWMQQLTTEFGEELDSLRKVCRARKLGTDEQNDARMQHDTTGSSQATGRLPLLIDALASGSEVFPQVADDRVDEASITMPST